MSAWCVESPHGLMSVFWCERAGDLRDAEYIIYIHPGSRVKAKKHSIPIYLFELNRFCRILPDCHQTLVQNSIFFYCIPYVVAIASVFS